MSQISIEIYVVIIIPILSPLSSRAGIRLKSSNVVSIKNVHYCKIINIFFVRQKSDFHAHVFFMSKGAQLAGPRRACAAKQFFRSIVAIRSSLL